MLSSSKKLKNTMRKSIGCIRFWDHFVLWKYKNKGNAIRQFISQNVLSENKRKYYNTNLKLIPAPKRKELEIWGSETE